MVNSKNDFRSSWTGINDFYACFLARLNFLCICFEPSTGKIDEIRRKLHPDTENFPRSIPVAQG